MSDGHVKSLVVTIIIFKKFSYAYSRLICRSCAMKCGHEFCQHFFEIRGFRKQCQKWHRVVTTLPNPLPCIAWSLFCRQHADDIYANNQLHTVSLRIKKPFQPFSVSKHLSPKKWVKTKLFFNKNRIITFWVYPESRLWDPPPSPRLVGSILEPEILIKNEFWVKKVFEEY